MYAVHNGWLIAWLHRKLGNRHDAADIAQDTFTRLCTGNRVQTLAEVREPRAYLVTVARRLMLNHLERRSLEQAYLESLQWLPEESVLSVEERAILLETLAQLDALLNELPMKVRTAFLLSQLDGLAYEAIATHLNVSVRTVTRYMAQGFRQCLRVMLED
ncbi:sigma-70 family RNA polymerase sigma factor [Diaphorobacter sp. HDW4A]|uniref:sigma-70 family RNA polymerase sigma factor n=1 Tax=Diaphorobacter sp. HDW4A TaxID=2714924 RepID=UPI0014090E66|nr:sigma-70 family RNA polymerase sigma factor [Diaphorobacter sp. HDW4A]QIL83737.1 sigma-70 family RNA polymerase sigma factor [Diaphorobacter sp. HDW4A]